MISKCQVSDTEKNYELVTFPSTMDQAGGNTIIKSLAPMRFTASATYPNYKPSNAILKSEQCWCPAESQKNQKQYLQIDLGRVLTIQGFEMQGHSSHGGGWCKTIRFETSVRDPKVFQNQGIYPGNKGPDDIKNNKLTAKDPVLARYIRFYPQKCGGVKGGWGKLRVEIFWTEPENYLAPINDIIKAQGETKTKEDTKKDKEKKKEKEKEINQDDLSGIPDLPATVVTLGTELVRLRGGPYWNESYALLRATKRALVDSTVTPIPVLCTVDHVTDGGRWILVGSWQSDQVAKDSTPENVLPKRTVGWEKGNINQSDPRPSVVNISQFGSSLGIDFEHLQKKYGQSTVVDEVRVFSCSLGSQRIIHYKTQDEATCSRVLNDVVGICKDVASPGSGSFNWSCLNGLPPRDTYETLSGHHRFGNGTFKYHCQPTHGCFCSPCYTPVARWTGCCATSTIPPFSKDIRLCLVWVRMRDGIVVSTDPNDPSFLRGTDGKLLTENPISGEFMQSSLKKSKKKDLNTLGSLDIIRQDTYEENDIEMMVRVLNKNLKNIFYAIPFSIHLFSFSLSYLNVYFSRCNPTKCNRLFFLYCIFQK